MPGKPRKYRLYPLARADLEEIWLYTVKTWSVAQADTYYKQLVSTFDALAAGKRRGRNIDHIRQGYFRLSVGSHFIFYRDSGAGLEIVRILHRRRDIERHL